uniref:EsaB/YukD family protein n=1 Tax=Nocardioides sp. TaxID=35761 RepID=UPI00356B42DB
MLLTAVSPDGRADLEVPGSVPLAELIPGLARACGALDLDTAHVGYRVGTSSGVELSADDSLRSQGVRDGAVLSIGPVEAAPPPVYDDVVEAMLAIGDQDLVPWSPTDALAVSAAAAGLSLVLGAAALLTQAQSLWAGVFACILAALLVAAAVLLSRVADQPGLGVGVGWLGCGYAFVGALMLGLRAGQPFWGVPLACAGAASLVAAAICVVGLDERRVLVLPPLALGVVGVIASAGASRLEAQPGLVLTAILALVVVSGSAFPALALAATCHQSGQPSVHPLAWADAEERAGPIDLSRLRAEARLARQLLVAMTVATGVLLVLLAPLSVRLGTSGAALAACLSLIMLLRTRHQRHGPEVLAGLISGVLGLASVAVSLLVLEPQSRPHVALQLTTAWPALCAVAFVSTALRGPWRVSRLPDLLETLCLLAPLPLLVVAS